MSLSHWCCMRHSITCALTLACSVMALESPATAQETATAWIHLSEVPIPFFEEEGPTDHYSGAGPELYAFLIADRIPGGFVSAIECGFWLDIQDESIEVAAFVPLDHWRLDDSPPDSFERWPSIPGQAVPAVLGYWPVRLLRAEESRGQIGLAPDSLAGIVEATTLTRTGAAIPLSVLRGAGINVEPPAPLLRTSCEASQELSWAAGAGGKDLRWFPQNGVIRLRVSYPGVVSWGELGIVVRDEGGAVSDLEFTLGPDPGHPDRSRGWVEAPSESWTWRQSGHLGFRHLDGHSTREILIDIPVRVKGPARRLTVDVPWLVFETPGTDRDTVWTTRPEAEVTALGGAGRLGYVVHTWAPKRAEVGQSLSIACLGDGLGQVRGVSLEGEGERHEAGRFSVERDGRRLEAEFPDGVRRPGSYCLIIDASPTEVGLAPVGHLIAEGDPLGPGGGRSDPWWVTYADTITADYVIVSTTEDNIHEEAEALGRAHIEEYSPHRTVCITLPEIRQAWPDLPDTLAIRSALTFAYENWRSAPVFALLVGAASEDVPQQDLIPTPHGCDDYIGYWGDCTYAMDWWYGDVVDGVEDAREIVIGRLPVWAHDMPWHYGLKLEWYALHLPPFQSVAFVVGDADNWNQENFSRREAAQRLMTYIESVSALETTALYSLDYAHMYNSPNQVDHPSEIEAGRDDVIGLLDNHTPGVAEFFGNTWPANEVTHILRYDNTGSDPQFRIDQLGGGTIWPLAIFSHCNVGAFDEYSWDWGASPIEDFVVDGARGAVVAVGKGAMSFFEADEEISRRLYEEVLDGSGGSTVGFQCSGAIEKYLTSAACSRPQEYSDARSVNIVGDPSAVVALAHPPRDLESSFEAWGAVPLQNRIAQRAAWISDNLDQSCATARLAHGGCQTAPCGLVFEQQVFPVDGQRMLRLAALHDYDGEPEKGAWTVFWRDPDAAGEPGLVELLAEPAPNTVLSFWVYHESMETVGNQLILDLVTSDGRYLSNFVDEGFYDQSGQPYDGQVWYWLSKWNHVWVRLEGWASEAARIDSVVARYEQPSCANGARALACVDAVYIGEWKDGNVAVEGNVILNGDFAEDTDGDGHPEFWPSTHIWAPAPPGYLLGGALALDCHDRVGQALPSMADCGCLLVELKARGAPGVEQNVLTVELQDLDDPTGLEERSYQLGEDWRWYRMCMRPSHAQHRQRLQLHASNGTAVIDSVSGVPTSGIDVPEADAHPSGSPTWLTPIVANGELMLMLPDNTDHQSVLELYSVDGRRLARSPMLTASGGSPVRIDLDDLAGFPLPSGVYFVRVYHDDETYDRRVLIVR